MSGMKLTYPAREWPSVCWEGAWPYIPGLRVQLSSPQLPFGCSIQDNACPILPRETMMVPSCEEIGMVALHAEIVHTKPSWQEFWTGYTQSGCQSGPTTSGVWDGCIPPRLNSHFPHFTELTTTVGPSQSGEAVQGGWPEGHSKAQTRVQEHAKRLCKEVKKAQLIRPGHSFHLYISICMKCFRL